MKLEKAIRRLQAFVRWRKPDPKDNFVESVQLGIEALKRVQQYRPLYAGKYPHLLPGETPEGEEVRL